MALRKADLITLYEELSKECTPKLKAQLLKKTGRGGDSASRDYVHANAVLSTLKKVNNSLAGFEDLASAMKTLHPAYRFRLGMYTPMLAARIDDLKPAEQKNLFENKNVLFTEKINGVRAVLVYYKGDFYFFSRNYSDVGCELPEYSSNVYQMPQYTEHLKELDPTQIYAMDCECVFSPGDDIRGELADYGIGTDSQLEAMCALLQTYPEEAVKIQKKFKEANGRDLVTFKLIQPLYFKGVNYMKKTLGEGKKVYKECIEFAKEMHLNIQPIKMCRGTSAEKENFLETILNQGGEGVVCHFWNGLYNTNDNRSKTGFVKIKRSVKAMLKGTGIGDTIDGFVTGFKLGSKGTANENLVSALEFSIYRKYADGTQRKWIIATCPNIPLAMKQKITVQDQEGNYVLEPKMYGRVAELDGQSLSAQAQKLTHPRILRFRSDKQECDCVYTDEFLASQADNNLYESAKQSV
nr:MAG TPA: DNA ligase I [Caudoviricetes sp.]